LIEGSLFIAAICCTIEVLLCVVMAMVDVCRRSNGTVATAM